MKYKFIFGPVPSRRLGISLGVDLVPHKTCSLNCIYCECGRTTQLTIKRKEYVPTEPVISELTHFLNSTPKLDYITFSGSGEPLLHSGIGEIIKFLKSNFPTYKIALLTNATLLSRSDVREEVKAVDLILPSLDAASEHIFKKLNRPVQNLKIVKIIQGLVEFRSIFSGGIWLEIFIVPGLNDTDNEINRLREAIHKIKPDRVQLNTLDRPGTEELVRVASRNLLEKVAHKLSSNTEIIANFNKQEKMIGYKADIEDTIVQTIKRRPCTVEDLSSLLGLHPNEIHKYLQALLDRKQLNSEKLERGVFFTLITTGQK